MLAQAARYVIKVVPDAAAHSIARTLASRTRRAPIFSIEHAAIAQATQHFYGAGRKHVAWVWGEGPTVVLVHGWGGRATQMAPLAMSLAPAGFRAVALDVTGHGASPKRHTRWEYFLRDIAALAHSLGEEVHSYVGHSAGGLTMMAARKVQGIRAQRYVCICAPSFPFPPIVAIQRRLNPRPAVLERYKQDIAAQFGTTWEVLEQGSSYAQAGADTLLVYDEKDRFVDHTEGDRIHALCPGARLVKTKANGHVKILAAPELLHTVGAFLSSRVS